MTADPPSDFVHRDNHHIHTVITTNATAAPNVSKPTVAKKL